jgi:hypothetical protein
MLPLLVSLVALAAAAARGADAPSWGLSPYRVHLLVAIEPGGSLAPDVAADLPAQAAGNLRTALGAAGRVELHAPTPELRTAMLADLPALTAADLPAEQLQGDKVLLVAIGERAGGWRVQARELDVTTGIWNATLTREVAHPAHLLASVSRALLAAFAPLARIESAEEGAALLNFRGGALAKPGRGLPISSGTVFRPLLLKSDSRGNVEPGSATPIPWTYLTITNASGGGANCRVETGLAGNPIPAYHPHRPRWALAVAPPTGTTQLRLVTSGVAGAPLEGCDVLAQPADIPGNDLWQRIGASDARGIVAVPAGKSVLQLLQVRQGQRPLARVPIVAGLTAELSLALPDDSQRVELEQSLAEVQDELVDLAARREALVARTKQALAAEDMALADKLKSQLGSLPGVETITPRLDQAAAAVKAADPGTKAALQPQVDALQKALDALAAQKPLEQFEEPKPEEPKPDESKAGGTKN